MICFLFVCRCNPLSNAHWCLVFGQYICWNGQRCAVVSGRFRNRRIVSYFSCAGYTNNNDLAGCRYIAGLQTNLSKMGTQTKKQCIEQTCQQRRCRSALRKGALLAARIVPKRFSDCFFLFFGCFNLRCSFLCAFCRKCWRIHPHNVSPPMIV